MIGYNKMTGYNVARYNADGTEIQKSDTVTIVDNTVTKNSQKRLTDLVTMADTVAKQQNKSVTDTVRMQAWLRLKKDQPDPWSD